ncbi:MAG: VOC family protein [Acidobacteriota bacterium]
MSSIVRTLGLVLALLGADAVSARPWVRDPRPPQYFAVSTGDVDRSVAWYRQVLDLRILDDTGAENERFRIVNLKGDGLLLEILRHPRHESRGGGRGFFKVGFAVKDVERVADRVERATGERPDVVNDEARGNFILQLKDPDGNTLQLFSPSEPSRSKKKRRR